MQQEKRYMTGRVGYIQTSGDMTGRRYISGKEGYNRNYGICHEDTVGIYLEERDMTRNKVYDRQ